MSRYDAHDTHCCAESPVLRNKADLTSQDELDAFEADITALRLVDLRENPVERQFDLQHLQRIHTALFQDVYRTHCAPAWIATVERAPAGFSSAIPVIFQNLHL